MAQSTVERGEEQVESMTEVLSSKVTPSQKRDAIMVAALKNLDMSSLLRVMSINDILAKAAEFRAEHEAGESA